MQDDLLNTVDACVQKDSVFWNFQIGTLVQMRFQRMLDF